MTNQHMKRVRVAVTGAAGQIGYAMLFRIASGAMLGPDVAIDLSLIELPMALDSLKGVAMELDDCAFPLLKSVTCTSDLDQGFKDADWCLLVGAMPRKEGMERKDLLAKNGEIFKGQGEAINRVSSRQVKVLVVGNPCNTNALIAMNHAPDIPKRHFFAMTMLDEKRAQAQLAIKAGVDVSSIENIIIWGNHSSTQFPHFDAARIDGKPATEVIKDKAWLETTFVSAIQQRGAAVIKARGASSAASAANAAIETVACIEGRYGERWFSVATLAEGQYGIEESLMVSMPCTVSTDGGLHVDDSVALNAFSQKQFALSLDELRQEQEAVKKLNYIN